MKRKHKEEIRVEMFRLFRGNTKSIRHSTYKNSILAKAGLASTSQNRLFEIPRIGILNTKLGHVRTDTLEMLDEDEIRMKESISS